MTSARLTCAMLPPSKLDPVSSEPGRESARVRLPAAASSGRPPRHGAVAIGSAGRLVDKSFVHRPVVVANLAKAAQDEFVADIDVENGEVCCAREKVDKKVSVFLRESVFEESLQVVCSFPLVFLAKIKQLRLQNLRSCLLLANFFLRNR